MANLAKCGDCAALTLNTDDDISKHRRWHKDWDRKFENTRTAATTARDQLAGLRNDIRGYEEQLSARPVEEPEQITVEDMPADEELGLEDDVDDQPVSTYAQDNTADTVALDPSDYPLAIDRDDPTPTPASVDMGNLYTPRNLM